ncbi:MAG: hypothetical protein WBI20_14995 [Burkholderiaceae bacterium]
MFNESQRQALIDAAQLKREDGFEEENPKLALVIHRLQQESPEKFHYPATLMNRRFYNEPRPVQTSITGQVTGIINRGFEVHADPRLKRKWASE